MKLSISPERHSFQRQSFIDNSIKNGKSLEDDSVKAMLEYYTNMDNIKAEQEASEEWKENNLEYDLRTTSWILEKVRNSEHYAQNLYAALCNNDFQKKDVIMILKDTTWSCSWRYAGGIVADMRETGDYIDWYCSGIKDSENDDRVSEGTVTDEIQEDLLKLGWKVVTVEGDS